MKENYNSHIMLPKQIISRFSYKVKGNGKYVKILNLVSLAITEEKINKLDTKFMYYEPLVETFLDKEVECKFGETSKKLYDEMILNKDGVSFKNDDLKNIRNFIKFSFLRNPDMLTKVIEGSALLKLIKGFTHGVLLTNHSAVDFFFENKKIIILRNNTVKGFVCPHNVIYYVYLKNISKYVLCITINSKMVLGLCNEIDDNHIDVLDIFDEQYIKIINRCAYVIEKNKKSPYIIGNELDLIELKKDIPNINENECYILDY